MKLEILLSCMYQKDFSIVEKSCITSDVLIINQSDTDMREELDKNGQSIRMITTVERGLSRSRNMAMKNARGSICLFCDNDEQFFCNYEQIVLDAFQRLQDADIILFDFENLPHTFQDKEYRLRFMDLFHAISCQIAYRRSSLESTMVSFHPFMGAGTGNGAQEENKFLIDCYKRGMKIYYVPTQIGCVMENESTWFNGYSEAFFYQRGGSTRQMLGLPLSFLYAIYYVVCKRNMYSHAISPGKAFAATIKGCFEDPIGKQMKRSGKHGRR